MKKRLFIGLAARRSAHGRLIYRGQGSVRVFGWLWIGFVGQRWRLILRASPLFWFAV